MKRLLTTSLVCITVAILFSFTLLKYTTLPAWYQYSGPYNLDYNYINYKKGNLYFYFDSKTSPVIKGDKWRGTSADSTFTGYLVNATDTNINLTQQDGSLIMIQEAQDPTGKWLPIEYWIWSDCGNSYFNSPLIGPNQMISFAIPKYGGSFSTKIRLKLKLGKGIFYSEPLKGSVNLEQFKKPKDTFGYISYLDDKKEL